MNEMKCSRCKDKFPEFKLQLSHDVPVYMFEGKDRKTRKSQADKHGRHYLCLKCHDIYEKTVFSVVFKSLSDIDKLRVKGIVKEFSISYFYERGLSK